METGQSCRVPWPEAFPEVVLHTDVKTRDSHPAYRDAKAGDAQAALVLARGLINQDALNSLARIIGGQSVRLLPVVADETGGFNAIPSGMALLLDRQLASTGVEEMIVQTNRVGHTRAPSFQRLVTPAAFAGPVVAGASYILVDDHVGLGGTLANLRGHVELNGGNVVAMTTLTESRDARHISLRSDTLLMLKSKYGDELDQLWRSHFGHGIDCLTDIEAGIIGRQLSVDAIADFLAQAASEARHRGLETALG